MEIDLLVQQLGAWSKKPGPLHHRLALAFEKAIQQGVLLPGTRLPAERKLAQALALSRTTVVTTYNNLRSDGWLESRLGSGTWVAAGRAAQARHSTHVSAVEGSPLINLLSANDADVVDLAVATPKPLAALPRHLFSISTEVQDALLAERNYMPFGLPALRDAIARHYQQSGVPTDPDQILVTAGAQQAISLATALYVQRGDTVLAENPTYFGALQAFRLAGARLTGLKVGPRHVETGTLRDKILAHGPRLIYITPTHQNPTGAIMPEMARRDIARLAEEFGIATVEDCSLAELEIEEKPPKPIAAFAQNSNMLSIGSLSKLYWAGLRIGWIRASAAVIAQLARVKSTADLGSPMLTQAVATQLLSALQQAKALRREQLTVRRDLLVQLLRDHFPDWSFSVPSGGLCLWIRLPGFDARHFAQFAARYGVALTPGSLFAIDGTHNEFLRLPYLLEEPALATGVLRLKAAWEAFRATASVELPAATAIV